MDRIDDTLREFFAVQAPTGLGRRLREALREEPRALEALIDKFHVEASERGIARLLYGRGRDVAAGRGRRHAEQARQELMEYLGGRRTFFTVPVDLGGIGEGLETVREALGHVKCGPIRFRKLDGEVGEVGRRLRAQVDDHVEDAAPCAAHHFRFGGRGNLKVQAAYGSGATRERDVRLSYHGFQSVCREFVLTERPREKSALVLACLEFQHVGGLEFRFTEQHRCRPSHQ